LRLSEAEEQQLEGQPGKKRRKSQLSHFRLPAYLLRSPQWAAVALLPVSGVAHVNFAEVLTRDEVRPEPHTPSITFQPSSSTSTWLPLLLLLLVYALISSASSLLVCVLSLLVVNAFSNGRCRNPPPLIQAPP
jgi:hypothetical protein